MIGDDIWPLLKGDAKELGCGIEDAIVQGLL